VSVWHGWQLGAANIHIACKNKPHCIDVGSYGCKWGKPFTLWIHILVYFFYFILHSMCIIVTRPMYVAYLHKYKVGEVMKPLPPLHACKAVHKQM
jgi:hypothetical protein